MAPGGLIPDNVFRLLNLIEEGRYQQFFIIAVAYIVDFKQHHIHPVSSVGQTGRAEIYNVVRIPVCLTAAQGNHGHGTHRGIIAVAQFDPQAKIFKGLLGVYPHFKPQGLVGPEQSRVLIQELQSLCLNVRVLDEEGNEIELRDDEEDDYYEDDFEDEDDLDDLEFPGDAAFEDEEEEEVI